MSYSTISTMQGSVSLLRRCTAAVAGEVTSGGQPGDTAFAPQWTAERSWDLAATPGWAAKWESAVASGVEDPGADEGVITDADVLARIQLLLDAHPIPDGP